MKVLVCDTDSRDDLQVLFSVGVINSSVVPVQLSAVILELNSVDSDHSFVRH